MIRSLEQLYALVARVTRRLDQVHAGRLQCRRGCSDCCVDGLTVFQVEADYIRRHHSALLEGGVPAPAGRCAFLDDEGGCRIYEHRPYVCRTQGYPLRWTEESNSGEEVWEMRDICPLNDQGTPVVDLGAEDCWSLGPAEARLRRLQIEHARRSGSPEDDAVSERVALRALFRTSEGGSR
ncbi:MAG: YkgJ family cysteine cluster protein [Candidatus Eisenbacteria bacterium]